MRTPDARTVKTASLSISGRTPVATAGQQALGATDVDLGQGDDVPWSCLAGPEGDEFDVLSGLAHSPRRSGT